MSLWINGWQAASRESAVTSHELSGHFRMGTKDRPDLPKFNGMPDKVRLHNRALSEEEVVAHIKQEATRRRSN